MIKLGTLTRKNDVHSLWSIIGDIWQNVKNNPFSSKLVEGYWLGNSLLSDNRLNLLLNSYDRLCQRYFQAYEGMVRLDGFSSKIVKRSRLDGFNLEYKFFNSDLSKDAKYIYPPAFLTNDFRSPNLIEPFFSGMTYRVYPKENKIVLIDGDYLNSVSTNLKNHVFIDEAKNPFTITEVRGNQIFYKKIFTNRDPVEGAIHVTSKVELEKNVDYIVEQHDDFLIFRFKDFNFIDPYRTVINFFTQAESYLYAIDVAYVDTFIESNFGAPLGFNQDDLNILKNAGLSWPQINQLILDFWKIDQRDYNFDQIYRLAGLFSGHDMARVLGSKLFLFKNDYVVNKVFLAENKNYVNTEIITYDQVPSDIITNNKIITKPGNIVLKVLSEMSAAVEINDPLILDGETYYIKRNINDKYIELDRVVSNHPLTNIVNILDKNTLRVYNLDSYGNIELNTFTELPNGSISNLSDILDINNKVKFGDLPWGAFLWGGIYSQQIYPGCRFKPLKIGTEYKFGDVFQPYILPNFYFVYDKDTSATEDRTYLNIAPDGQKIKRTDTQPAPIVVDDSNKIISKGYIQKQLALTNKEFIDNNFKEYEINKTLLLLPFFNYSKKLQIVESDLFDEGESQWEKGGDVTYKKEFSSNYIYTNITTDVSNNDSFVKHDIDLSLNNKTNLSILRLFVRLKKGKIRIGLSNGDEFSETSGKFIFNQLYAPVNPDYIPKWEHVNIFVDLNKFPSGLNTLLIESVEDSEYDIFGVEVFNSIPAYFKQLFLNKELLTKFLTSQNYKLINLL